MRLLSLAGHCLLKPLRVVIWGKQEYILDRLLVHRRAVPKDEQRQTPIHTLTHTYGQCRAGLPNVVPLGTRWPPKDHISSLQACC